jgi:serine protease
LKRIALSALLPACLAGALPAQELPHATVTQLQTTDPSMPPARPLPKAISKALARIFVDNFERHATLSGTLRSGPATDTDGDTNDPYSPLTSNDTPQTAQRIASVGVVGGYVSALGGGNPDGRFFANGDRIDAYRANLAAGQLVQLVIHDHIAANPNAVDLDLYLLSSDGSQMIANSAGSDASEGLTVPAGGEYLVVVRAYVDPDRPQNQADNRSNYTLLLSAPAGLQASAKAMTEDVIEDRFVITFDNPERAAATAKALRANKATHGMHLIAQGGPLALVSTKEALLAAKVDALRGTDAPVDAAMSKALRQAAAIKSLSTLPGVRRVEPDRLLHTAMTPDDPLFPLLWHYQAINTPAAWDVTLGGPPCGTGMTCNATTVAVIDSGIRPHDDLDANVVRADGFDFISNVDQALDGDGMDADPTDPGDAPTSVTGGSFHGIHVAGTIAAVTNNGTGIAGVAPNAKIMPLRTQGKGGNGSLFDIAQAVYYAAALPNASNRVPQRRADVINMSLGAVGANSPALADAVLAAHNAGVIVVAAAGNHSTSDPAYPASHPGAVSVSALDQALQPAPYTGFGANIDVSAPGGDVTADLDGNAVPDGVLSTLHKRNEVGVIAPTYDLYQGTSMAAPHVAGMAALMKSVFPGLTPDQFDTLLAQGALTTDVARNNRVRHDKFGYGMMNASLAVAAASREAGGTQPGPVLGVSPDRLAFDPTRLQQTLRLANVGSGQLTIQSVAAQNATWLAIGAPVQEANALAFPLTATPGALPAGTYSGAVRIVTGDNRTTDVPATLQIDALAASRNTGFQYVLAINSDIEGAATPYAFGSPDEQGALDWRIEDVPAGDYILIAGTDHDYDGFICDPGEACGGWPSSENLQSITLGGVDRDIGEFAARYSAPIKRLDVQGTGWRRPKAR